MAAPIDLHVVDGPASDPSAPIVVIVHGAMDRSASFGRVVRHLDGLHVIRYDRRGYGQSAACAPGSLTDHVDDLLAVIDGRAVTVFGHSIGGVIGLIAAERAPAQVRAVLAYEAPAPWAPWWPQPASSPPEDPAEEAEAFMRRAIGDHFWSRLPARTRAARRAEGGALRADIASLQGTAPYEAAHLEVPVLAAAGAETTWWHQRATRELADAAPAGEHAVVAGAEHGAHLTHPTATAHLVRRAVDRASGVE
ncbi:alpha/beta fold hydrolase [Aquihabitans daechungensis]|uniref:alpha/beta fold hydrolase n=1 Tax=Aquihabitans daechungensis TaxID=1052257 RepID=UPI003BA1FB06